MLQAETYEHVLFEREGNIARVTMNRPEKRNALSLAHMQELISCLKAIGEEKEASVVILGGSGPAFCAGHDLSEMVGRDPEFYRRLFDVCCELMETVQSIPQPVIAKVHGVAINFDGELAAIRGDSTYIVDPTLRLQGILQTSNANAGLDFHPGNTGLNSTPLSTRLAFAASSQPIIEIYDTNCYRRVATIPVRDPIIGPIKSSVRPNGEMVLVGASARGVIIVSTRTTFPTNCP